jgi:hypothetical protein
MKLTPNLYLQLLAIVRNKPRTIQDLVTSGVAQHTVYRFVRQAESLDLIVQAGLLARPDSEKGGKVPGPSPALYRFQPSPGFYKPSNELIERDT